MSCCRCGWSEDLKGDGPDGLQFCEWCEQEVLQLSPAERRDLLALQRIPPAFAIWDSGRREDSAGRADDAWSRPPQPAEIAPNLFVGDLDDACDYDKLKRLGIGFVLDLCGERLTGAYAGHAAELARANIVHLAWPAEDSTRFDIIANVVQLGALDFIEHGLRSSKVLVHCWGGVNRSAAVAIAFRVLRQGAPLVEAVSTAMQRRGTILTNPLFRFLLVRAAAAQVAGP